MMLSTSPYAYWPLCLWPCHTPVYSGCTGALLRCAGTSLVAPRHAGSSFPKEGLNLRPLHWTTREVPYHTPMYVDPLDECLLRPFAHRRLSFYDRVVRILFIYRIQVLIRFLTCKYFFLFCGLSSPFLDDVLRSNLCFGI